MHSNSYLILFSLFFKHPTSINRGKISEISTLFFFFTSLHPLCKRCSGSLSFKNFFSVSTIFYISKKWKFLWFLKYSSIEGFIHASRYLILFLCLFFSFLLTNIFVLFIACFFMNMCLMLLSIWSCSQFIYAVFICLVGIFFSWLTCLWFISSLISKSKINHYNLFFKANTDMYFR